MNKSKKLISHLAILFLIVGAASMVGLTLSNAASPVCPDASLGETQLDCPWAGVARTLIAEADAGTEIDASLAKLLPDLIKQLKADTHRGAWRLLWGRSINFDELANGVIVHPAILSALARQLKMPLEKTAFTHAKAAPHSKIKQAAEKSAAVESAMNDFKERTSENSKSLIPPGPLDDAGHQVVPAGLEHTYGYLFSVLKTSFGYKRARWVDGEIARGFGLPEGLLGPRPAEGSLFSNVTYFAGSIAFRDEPSRLQALKAHTQGLPKALSEFEFGTLKPVRLEETVEARDLEQEEGKAGDTRTVVLRTDLVPFTQARAGEDAPASANTHLLIYSVKDPSRGGSVLISAFPVTTSFVGTVLKADDLGEGKPIKSRYNAFVAGVSGKTLQGIRKVIR
jgi:hypothetical protein